MTKYICDVCGKELTKKDPNTSFLKQDFLIHFPDNISVQATVDITVKLHTNPQSPFDICLSCLKTSIQDSLSK